MAWKRGKAKAVVSAVAAAQLLALAGIAAGAAPVNGGRISLRGATLDASKEVSALDAAAFGPGRHVMILDGPMSAARRAALEGAGVGVGSYLPTNAFIADVSKANPALVKQLGFVTWAGEYRKEWKVDAALLKGAHGRPFKTTQRVAMADQGLVAAKVWLFDGEPVEPARAAILKIANAQVTEVETVAGTPSFTVIMPGQDVARLADIAGVQFAEHVAEYTARGGNSQTAWIIQTNQIDYTPLYDMGIDGTGQIAGVIDGGIATTHCAFFDPAHPIGVEHRKIRAYNETFQQADVHGTHVSGTLAGDAGATDDTRGIAYKAKLVFAQWPDPTEASQYAKHLTHANQGARVHNNSWGDDSITAYDSACRGIDAFQFDLDENLIVFAVTDDPVTVRNPENAKNSLAVSAGGSDGFQDNRCMGGWAPTADGRRKPEVIAPGCGISSAIGTGCAVTSLSGTSMAAPAVSGAAVLVRQYFMNGFYPTGAATPANAFTPSGAMVKAFLTNSAEDMAGVPGFPSDQEGWGRITIANNMGFAPDGRKLLLRDVRNASAGGLMTGETSEFAFYVSPCASSLKVTLAYHDAPALANAESAAVNNLDLTLVSPQGLEYKGNWFNENISVPGGSSDTINNLEQVLIPSAAAGPWTARVSAAAVNSAARQGFALVISGPIDQALCGTADFNCDGDFGTDADIEAFFAALAGNGPGDVDFNRDGDVGTDADIEGFFRVLAGNPC